MNILKCIPEVFKGKILYSPAKMSGDALSIMVANPSTPHREKHLPQPSTRMSRGDNQHFFHESIDQSADVATGVVG